MADQHGKKHKKKKKHKKGCKKRKKKKKKSSGLESMLKQEEEEDDDGKQHPDVMRMHGQNGWKEDVNSKMDLGAAMKGKKEIFAS